MSIKRHVIKGRRLLKQHSQFTNLATTPTSLSTELSLHLSISDVRTVPSTRRLPLSFTVLGEQKAWVTPSTIRQAVADSHTLTKRRLVIHLLSCRGLLYHLPQRSTRTTAESSQLAGMQTQHTSA